MAITSAEIHNQSFSIDRKGYDVDEVDVFLEHVADEIDGMNAQIAQLENQLDDSSVRRLRHAGSRRSSRRRDGRCRAGREGRAHRRFGAPARGQKGRRQRHRAGSHHRAAFCRRDHRERECPGSGHHQRCRGRGHAYRGQGGSRAPEGARRHQEARGRPRGRARGLPGACSPTSSATPRASWPRSAARCPLRPCPRARTPAWSETTVEATGRVMASRAGPHQPSTARARTPCPQTRRRVRGAGHADALPAWRRTSPASAMPTMPSSSRKSTSELRWPVGRAQGS